MIVRMSSVQAESIRNACDESMNAAASSRTRDSLMTTSYPTLLGGATRQLGKRHGDG